MATPGPLKEALRFDGPLHGVFLNWLRMIGNKAALANEEKHQTWNRVEMANRLYADPDAVDDKGNLRNPQDNLLVIPWTRLSRDACVSSIWIPWVTRDPFMPLSGREPDDIIRAQLMAARCQYDVDGSSLPLKMYPWIGNAVDFGVGAMTNYWVEDRRVRVYYGPDGRRRELVEHYVGNWPTLVDPYRLLADPDVPIGDIQSGSMAGYSTDMSHAAAMRLAMRKNARGDGWINVDQIKSGKWGASDPFLFGSQAASLRNRVQNISDPGESAVWGSGSMVEGGGRDGTRLLSYHIRTCIEVLISPRDLIAIAEGGGVTGFAETLSRVQPADDAGEPSMKIEADDLQYWKFEMIDGRVIVDMEPLAQTEFSMYVLEPDPDLLSRYVPGRAELAMPLQDQINRVINRHNANVDKGLYNTLIVDQEAIDLGDLYKAIGGGGPVRKMPDYAGSMRDAVVQLQWNDATRQDIADIPMYQDLIMRLHRTSDQGMGQVSQGRRAAYDVAAAQGGANVGIQTMSKLMAWQGINRLLRSFVRNIQLYDTAERWVRITGALEQTLRGSQGPIPPPLQALQDQGRIRETPQGMMAQVTFEDVQGDFDIAVLDGRPEGPNVQEAQAYSQLMQILGQMGAFNPGPQGQPPRFDPMWFVKRFAEKMGVRNLRDAELQPMPNQPPMVPPEIVEQQRQSVLDAAQAGNIAPVNEGSPYG